MTDNPDGYGAGTHKATPVFPPPPAEGWQPPAYVWEPPRSPVVVKPDLIPAISVVSTVSLVGLLVGWLWSLLAPPVRKVIGQDGPVTLVAESYHRFDALVLFTLLCLSAGIVTGVAVWFLRERRGPVAMVAAVVGSGLGGWLASLVGGAWANGRYPAPASVEILDLVYEAPRLESIWGLLAWPLATALVYGMLASWNGMDDLGRRLG